MGVVDSEGLWVDSVGSRIAARHSIRRAAEANTGATWHGRPGLGICATKMRARSAWTWHNGKAAGIPSLRGIWKMLCGTRRWSGIASGLVTHARKGIGTTS